MKNTDNNLRALGLSQKEEKTLLALQNGADTPLVIARKTSISRPAVYAILKNLKKRGIAEYHTRNGKKRWKVSDEREIDRAIADAKRELLNIPEGREEVYGQADTMVVIHRGEKAIKNLLHEIIEENKGERLYGYQGKVSSIGWDTFFSVSETNRLNRAIKDNHLIVEAVIPDGWFEEQVARSGIEWAKEFEGRTTRVNVIDPKYFEHGGQMFLFKKSLYLFALNEGIIIEIRNSEIQKMILAMFEFIQDNSRAIDANELLRTLIAKQGDGLNLEFRK
ncbi:MAG: hypothetical protein A3D67_02375 [Candidatus Lloydbacteria bacterium RIFCSPHIGHO2_02_FULL_51_22]|uniref:Transcription regulator TrmB N-terminal domain-containing protein n=3 Tax=Candidatus Lloydiibacteriota TaxID=1817910 RepID=A0A1G2DGL7_9BACT|nr:MAG: hypothetical protein A3D67_02375 [Candidatus Lloydbacteria bacterium RIFCSPHIGHO2_02_FULL_51_22]OGZ14062.1 MAG: hypothetical protein A3J08_04015 [Candidatus Lloydbacteria bacterium RIFCSPLOWO2_02_FULL_51_11]OGZ17294.1 MAG: hypothetical protein A3G11_01840 [Candidatus Lloydbacteria bacterium RIFCSPLOWO2_12_FULL_51_9]